MTAKQLVVSGPNLSHVWARVFLQSMSRGAGDACPLIASVTGFDDDAIPEEDSKIRTALDETLGKHKPWLNCHTVANTIFPASLWRPHRPRQELFDLYERIWPRLQARRVHHNTYPNKNGTYFRRFTAFGGTDNSEPINQLKHILDAWDKRLRRRSAFQLAVFDPQVDHKPNPYLGFPCLHQVSFTRVDGGSLHVTALYGLQYLVQRAYGNYLGLCSLGRFMAREMKLRLGRVTCIASAATLDFKKTELRDLENRVQESLPATVLRRIGSDDKGALH